MPTIDVAYNHTTKTVTVLDDGASLPAGSTAIGSFDHPDETYPDSVVIFHGVRDLLYKRKPTGEEGFWPDNITDMESGTIVNSLTVPVELTGISATPTTLSIVEGEDDEFTVAFTPSNATNKTLTVVSSNEGTATASLEGTTVTVTGVAEGTAIITVTGANALTASVEVTVTAEDIGDDVEEN